MNTLVVGGAGYLGSVLVSVLLENGHRVRVLDNLMHRVSSLLAVWSHPNFEFKRGDTRDHQMFASVLDQTDAVIQLAAIVGDPACARQPELARAVNLDASLALLEESRKTGVSRFIFASTCSNYGRMKDRDAFVDETSELCPVSLYAETKVAVERTLLDPIKTGELCATALRFATIFGVSPRMRFDLTVNEFTMEMLTKKHLVVFGAQFWRPYVHVHDVARAIALVLEAPTCKVRNEVFNVGANGQNYQKQQLVELIRMRVPDAIVEYVHKDEDPRDYRVSFTKIKKELGFGITRTVQDGIAEIAKLVGQGVIEDFDDPRYRN
jgi:nucleoside-diphosphate-sugar epimerase